MKFASRSLLLVSLAATFAYAQTLPHFDHIIIVVHENRTPDNLFGSNPQAGGMHGQLPV
jgi:phospholipase C